MRAAVRKAPSGASTRCALLLQPSRIALDARAPADTPRRFSEVHSPPPPTTAVADEAAVNKAITKLQKKVKTMVVAPATSTSTSTSSTETVPAPGH